MTATFMRGDRVVILGQTFRVWGRGLQRDTLLIYGWRDVVAGEITLTAFTYLAGLEGEAPRAAASPAP